MGRKPHYGQAERDEVIARLKEGETLRSICRSDHLPAIATVIEWRDKCPEFAEQYDKARQVGWEILAEELLDIADDGSNDYIERMDPDNPGYVSNGELVQRSRLRLDTRKWLLSKCLPKIYGEKQKIEHEGNVPVTVTVKSYKELDDG